MFAALGDGTRLALVARLAAASPQSITRLAGGARISRQAITRHLRVLEGAGVVEGVRVGREIRFAYRPEPVAVARSYLAEVSAQWDERLARLKAFLED